MSPRTKEQNEEIREERRQVILNAALELFAENGYHSTPISAIAKKAGVSKGLIYNYFKSKEEILLVLYEQYIDLISNLMDQNKDNEITNEEMERFFRLLTESMEKDNHYWKLYFHLSMQREVLELMRTRMRTGETLIKYAQLTYNYFADRFPNPQSQMLLFSFIIKGFSLQYVLSPESVPQEEIEPFWQRMKELFVVEKKKTED